MRWIDLEGAVNVRDLGGLPTDDGVTAYDVLVRADNLQALTDKDIRVLVDDVGVRTVVDLRSPGEVESEGPGPLIRVPTVEHRHFSVLPEGGARTDAAADAAADPMVTRRERALERFPEDPVVAYYLGYLEDRPDSIVAALGSIAASPGATIVHCAAGKDRTGVVVALALTVAGVPRDVVVDDYAVTGERIEPILDRLRSSPTYAGDVDKLPADAHRPRGETMRTLFAALDEQYGGPLAWLASHGFGPADVTALRDRLLDR